MTKPWILITGGAKRIGAYLNRAFAKQGYNIVLHYNQSQNDAKQLASELIETGCEVVLWQYDLTKPNALNDSFAQLLTKIPQLDVLINSASLFEQASIESSTLSDIENNLHVHLTSPWLLTQTLIKRKVSTNIINILDANASHKNVQKVPYSISKNALAEFTELAAIEAAPNIRVNAVALGYVLDANDQENRIIATKDMNLMQQQVALQDIFSTLLFLISNTSITGQIINIDGGSHLKCPSYMLKN